jgi:cysteine desulfuration protein SufE
MRRLWPRKTTFDIIDTFELLGDWDQRYEYLVELGERLPPMDPADKTDANRVMECMSTVHVVARARSTATPSAAALRGRLRHGHHQGRRRAAGRAVLRQDPRRDRETDVDALSPGCKLEEHLSPNRHVGVYAIVNKMKRQARDASRRSSR